MVLPMSIDIGSTDASITEKEAIFVRYFDPNPPNQNTVKACHAFVGWPDLESGKASGIIEAIQSSLDEIGSGDERKWDYERSIFNRIYLVLGASVETGWM